MGDEPLVPANVPTGADIDELIGSVASWHLSALGDPPVHEVVLRLSGCPLRCLTCRNPRMRSDSGGRDMSLAEVVHRLGGCRDLLLRSGGGLTLTGGDPFAQPRFTAQIVHRAHQDGIPTTVETPGYLGALIPDAVLADIDLVVLNLNSADAELSRSLTGQDADPALRFLRRLAELRHRVRVRFLVVPGITDGRANITGMARTIDELGPTVDLQLAGFTGGRRAPGDRLAAVPAACAGDLARARRIFAEADCVPVEPDAPASDGQVPSC